MKTLSLDLGLPTPEMPTLDLSRCHSRPVSHRTAARMVEEFHYAHRVREGGRERRKGAERG